MDKLIAMVAHIRRAIRFGAYFFSVILADGIAVDRSAVSTGFPSSSACGFHCCAEIATLAFFTKRTAVPAETSRAAIFNSEMPDLS